MLLGFLCCVTGDEVFDMKSRKKLKTDTSNHANSTEVMTKFKEAKN